MELKVAANSLQWSQPSFASPKSSPSRRRLVACASAGPLFSRYIISIRHMSRSRSNNNKSSVRTRALPSTSDSFPDKEFSKNIQELSLRFNQIEVGSSTTDDSNELEPPVFRERNIEWKANSVDIPMSLRMIKRKKQWQEGLLEAGESAYCSVKRAFSSMVFIIRELHSFTLQMREVLLYEDLQGIITRVQKDLHASFVWLFQKVFSHTPTLMVYVMILLANYSVYSLSSNAIIVPIEETSVVEDRSINLVSLNGRAAMVGDDVGGGGGKHRPVVNGMDGDGRFDGSNCCLDDVSLPRPVSQESREDSECVDAVDVSVESDDHSEHWRTEIQYETQLACNPNDSLLLANYAQFLYVVAKEYDRAEEYFKRAIKEEPKDAEALNKYANFLWRVRDDLWAAEETYLEAISVEPTNSYYAASYAHFLWNTGGEDTCFPLSSPDADDDTTCV